MAINNTIELAWDGKSYPVLVTMGLIDLIEQDINLVQFMREVERSDLRTSKIAKLFSILLSSAGCEVSQEQVYEGMFGSGEVQPELVVVTLYQVFAAVFPEPPKKSKPQ